MNGVHPNVLRLEILIAYFRFRHLPDRVSSTFAKKKKKPLKRQQASLDLLYSPSRPDETTHGRCDGPDLHPVGGEHSETLRGGETSGKEEKDGQDSPSEARSKTQLPENDGDQEPDSIKAVEISIPRTSEASEIVTTDETGLCTTDTETTPAEPADPTKTSPEPSSVVEEGKVNTSEQESEFEKSVPSVESSTASSPAKGKHKNARPQKRRPSQKLTSPAVPSLSIDKVQSGKVGRRFVLCWSVYTLCKVLLGSSKSARSPVRYTYDDDWDVDGPRCDSICE